MLEIVWSIYILKSRLNGFYVEIHFLLAPCEIQRSNCVEWLQDPFIGTIQEKDHFDFGLSSHRAFCLVLCVT